MWTAGLRLGLIKCTWAEGAHRARGTLEEDRGSQPQAAAQRQLASRIGTKIFYFLLIKGKCSEESFLFRLYNMNGHVTLSLGTPAVAYITNAKTGAVTPSTNTDNLSTFSKQRQDGHSLVNHPLSIPLHSVTESGLISNEKL